MSTAGRYRQVMKLGEGTYGSVYKGTDVQTGKVVAFKRMTVTSEDEGVPGAAIREISLLKELRHDNVVGLFDVLFELPKITMIFELCDCDLKRFMDTRPQRFLDAETELRPILKQIFVGLAYLHGRSVVHRDMKPQNIFVNVRAADFAALISLPSRSPDAAASTAATAAVPGRTSTGSRGIVAQPPSSTPSGGGIAGREERATPSTDGSPQLIVKIGDFGLARVEDIPVKKYSHEVVTLWYRCPDVLMGSALYYYAVDVWSMGAIFFEMATGRVLFNGRNEDEQLLRMFWLLGSPTRETWPSLLSYPGTRDRLERAARIAAGRADLHIADRDDSATHVSQNSNQHHHHNGTTSGGGSGRATDLLTQLAYQTFYHSPKAVQEREETLHSTQNSYQLPLELWFDRPLFDAYMSVSGFNRGVTPEGVDLLRRCLQYEPAERTTAAAAVLHPYLASVPVPTAGALDVLMTSLLQTMEASHIL